MSALALIVAMFLQSSAPPPQPSFDIDPTEISIGGSAQLRWSCPGAKRGYLSSVGLVDAPRGGTITVTPTETTDYVIIFETAGEPIMMSRRVAVRGSKRRRGRLA
jgi:hypothetical protein